MRLQRGFSLIELIVCILILLVLAGIGTPMVSRFLQNSKVSSMSNGFVSMVNLARSEAIRRNTQVTLCGLTAAKTCISAASGNATPFETYGWAVFEDAPAGASTLQGATAAPTQLIRVENGVASGVLVRSTFAYATFTPRGLVRMDSGIDGSVKLCKSSYSGSECDTGANVRCILISTGGSPSIFVPTGTASGTAAAIAGAGTTGGSAGCV
jgi:type IV fimbrial biogenesis protein FimT